MMNAVLILAITLSLSPGDYLDPTPIPGVKRVILDPADDHMMRRTDIGDTYAPLSTNGPEFIYATLGRWEPVDAYADPYIGNYSTNGGYVKIDLVFKGLVNPPGPVVGPYQPAQYGTNPLNGWMEIDLDANENTGGNTEYEEVDYVSHVARFGGVPQGDRFLDRISLNGDPWNEVWGSSPAIYRSGGDLSYRFQGDFISDVDDIGSNGDGDSTFEAGETWLVTTSTRSAYGYDPTTYAGGYGHLIKIRFLHSIEDDQTYVTLVLSRTNSDYAILNNEATQSNDFNSLNATSLYEYLWNLTESGTDPKPGATNHDYWPMLSGWAMEDPADHLDPTQWKVTMLWGTRTVANPVSGRSWIGTDVWPNPVIGDFNGDGLVTETDRQTVVDFVTLYDGNTQHDADGTVNSVVEIVDFKDRFSVYDIDYDGLVSTNGIAHQLRGDYNNDGDVDLADFQWFQLCYSETTLLLTLNNVGCLDAFDDNDDRDIDLEDFYVFRSVLGGP